MPPPLVLEIVKGKEFFVVGQGSGAKFSEDGSEITITHTVVLGKNSSCTIQVIERDETRTVGVSHCLFEWSDERRGWMVKRRLASILVNGKLTEEQILYPGNRIQDRHGVFTLQVSEKTAVPASNPRTAAAPPPRVRSIPTPPQGQQLTLQIISGVPTPGKQPNPIINGSIITITQDTIVGRQNTDVCHLLVNSSFMGRGQFIVRFRDKKWSIFNRGEQNPTLLNGKTFTRTQELHQGDIIGVRRVLEWKVVSCKTAPEQIAPRSIADGTPRQRVEPKPNSGPKAHEVLSALAMDRAPKNAKIPFIKLRVDQPRNTAPILCRTNPTVAFLKKELWFNPRITIHQMVRIGQNEQQGILIPNQFSVSGIQLLIYPSAEKKQWFVQSLGEVPVRILEKGLVPVPIGGRAQKPLSKGTTIILRERDPKLSFKVLEVKNP